MEFVTDLHLHSKYSRAVSPQMELGAMAQMARLKGIDILSAADFTHPLWFKELTRMLEEKEEGLYSLKSQETNHKIQTNSNNQNVLVQKEPLFLLSVEIASIYKQGDKLRRIHNLVFAPSLEVADRINKELVKRGCNLSSDGRPIIGLSSRDLLELLLDIDERCMLIPAHIWTPHFGIYGSASGFDSFEEAFGDLSEYVYGIETGLSSDPEMNWQVKELQNRSILSFSDAHSLPKMGREVTVFEMPKASYENIRNAIMRRESVNGNEAGIVNRLSSNDTSLVTKHRLNRIVYSLEFYPEEGKYHFSGHRNCDVSIDPMQVVMDGNLCPVCKRRMTEGVLYRVQQLSDQTLLHRAQAKISNSGLLWYTDLMKMFPPYLKLVPLNEIIAASVGSSVMSQKVKGMFTLLCEQFGSEIAVLLKASLQSIAAVAGERVSEGVKRIREGRIQVEPGYDGLYGKVSIWADEQKDKILTKKGDQLSLVD